MSIPLQSSGQMANSVQHEIIVRDYAFIPETKNINIGDSVVFVWEDNAIGHNVEQVSNSKDTTYDSGGFRSGDPRDGPHSWTLPISFTQGNVTLFYICNPHVLSHNMRGKIIIGAGSEDTADSGANVTAILGIFIATGVFTVGVIVLLQRQKKAS